MEDALSTSNGVNMRGYILLGSENSKGEFIENFIKKNTIPPYNIVRFENDLKISDARALKRSLSTTSLDGRARLFIIEANPTHEAQNALLKLLEELPENTTIIFIRERELLPTIVSRCSQVTLGNVHSRSLSEEDMQIVSSLLNSRYTSRKLFEIEKFFSKEREDSFADLILCVREAVLKEAPNKFELLKELVKYYPLVYSNNLNPKLTLERVLLAHKNLPLDKDLPF